MKVTKCQNTIFNMLSLMFRDCHCMSLLASIGNENVTFYDNNKLALWETLISGKWIKGVI